MVMPMNQSTTTTHSFIVKIWLEDTAEEAKSVTWRGHITHVFSGKRRYLQDLDDIAAFITPYLRAMGGKPSLSWRIRQWFRRPQLLWRK